MNVQLAANAGRTRFSQPTEEGCPFSNIASAIEDLPSSAPPVVLSEVNEHKWLGAGFFLLTAGWIILNSVWSTAQLGYLLMLIGLLLPLVPLVGYFRVRRQADRAHAAMASRAAEGRKQVARGFIYELSSTDYTFAS